MNLTTSINLIREYLEKLSPEERLDVFDKIVEGYCFKCGEKCETICYCERDE